jgi:hypothetical protein
MRIIEIYKWLWYFNILYTFDNTRYVGNVEGYSRHKCCFCNHASRWATYIYMYVDYPHACTTTYHKQFGIELCDRCYHSALKISTLARIIAYRAIDVMNGVLVKDVCNMIKHYLKMLFEHTYPHIGFIDC